jgi:ribonuclease P protein component
MNTERVFNKVNVQTILDHGYKVKTPVGPFFFINCAQKKNFIIVKKKYGNAVSRNYIKRFYREIIRIAVNRSNISISSVLFYKSSVYDGFNNLVLLFHNYLVKETGKNFSNGKNGL